MDDLSAKIYMSIFTRSAFISAHATLTAFRHRNYRLWFSGQLVSLIGTWMQNVAQGYLLYSLTGSVAYLGYVGFLRGLPSWLIMIYSGLIADRVPRRVLLIITQSAKPKASKDNCANIHAISPIISHLLRVLDIDIPLK